MLPSITVMTRENLSLLQITKHQWLLIIILQSSCHTQPHAITASMGIVRVKEKPQPLKVHSTTHHYKNQAMINRNAGSYILFMEYLPIISQNNQNKTMNEMLEKMYLVVHNYLPKTVYLIVLYDLLYFKGNDEK